MHDPAATDPAFRITRAAMRASQPDASTISDSVTMMPIRPGARRNVNIGIVE